MRRLAAVLTVLLLAGCGDDDADRDGEGLTEAQARDAVGRTLPDADDLGAGWSLTDTTAPGDEDAGDDLLTACLGGELRRPIEATTLATSEQRHFRREGGGTLASTRVSVLTKALDDTTMIGDVLEELGIGPFHDCLASEFGARAGETELRLRAGEPTIDDDYLGLEGVRSGHVRVPFTANAPGFEFEAELDVLVVSRGQLLSTMSVSAYGQPVDGEDVARWAALLADRQRLIG